MNYYNEIDRFAAQWLRNLIAAGEIPAGYVDERSITDVTADDVKGFTQCHWFAGIGGWSVALRLAGIPDDAKIWTGSPPCQPYSTAGKNLGQRDSRHLWPHEFRLIKECRPAIVFGEQVAAAIGHGWLDEVSADLEGENYAFASAVIGAHSVRADHIRQRLYFFANTYSTRCQNNEGWKGSARQTRGEKPSPRFAFARLRQWVSEPGLCIAVHGVHACPSAVRGYGNAIVPQLAAEFILASLDAIQEVSA